MPKARVSSGVRSAAQKAAQLKAAKASAAKRRKTPVGRKKMLDTQMNKLDHKKNKTSADKKKLDKLYSRYKSGRSGASRAAEAKVKGKRKSMWKNGVGSKAFGYGTGN